MDKNQIGLAGEFYVLAQLAQRGFVGTLTLGHTKGIDILVSNSRFRKLFRVEVKTTRRKPHHEHLTNDQTGRSKSPFGESAIGAIFPLLLGHRKPLDIILTH